MDLVEYVRIYMCIWLFGCKYTYEGVCVRECMCLNVRETTCESVCLGANIHVNVGVREWMCLNVRESTC